MSLRTVSKKPAKSARRRRAAERQALYDQLVASNDAIEMHLKHMRRLMRRAQWEGFFR
jgi:hypothetical protein